MSFKLGTSCLALIVVLAFTTLNLLLKQTLPTLVANSDFSIVTFPGLYCYVLYVTISELYLNFVNLID